jgi:hypothetical protein
MIPAFHSVENLKFFEWVWGMGDKAKIDKIKYNADKKP